MTKAAAAIAAVLMLGSAQAAGTLEDFQKRVNEAAAKAGVEAPDVRKELAAQPGTSVKTEPSEPGTSLKKETKGKRIEKVVSIPADQVRVIKPSGGAPLVYVIGNGRFAFTGPLIDVWSKKKLTSIEEIERAINLMDLVKLGFQAEKLNLIRVGEGSKVVTVFLDPRCGWCHRLLREIQEYPDFFKNYRLDMIVAAVLGEDSTKLARHIACAEATDKEKYEAFVAGARAIEALKVKADCKSDALERTELTMAAFGIDASPFVIAPDGRVSRGKPANLRAFLEPPAEEKAQK